ncbi:cilia- and flagella-associated protein 45-like [Salarias fasciatus]|uniref:cilia- and flagella-associated protein 45-like n=1 Tax=Salarias fasciatus TaxID=181472 RepID=UPI0011769BE5|nr:cilia- and flagella-associated protein 45-like [Salarias fasciatus]
MNPALITNIGLHDTLKPIDDKIVYTKFQNQRHSQVENKRKTEAECREEEKRMHSMRDSERLRALEVEKDMAKKRREQEVTISAEAKQAQQKVVEEERLEDLKIADYIEEKDEERF